MTYHNNEVPSSRTNTNIDITGKFWKSQIRWLQINW